MRLQYLGQLVIAAATVLLPTQARAQDQSALERVGLRVTLKRGPGRVIVDCGKRDKLAVGDRVFLYPRGGGSATGTVASAGERSAVVQLDDPRLTPSVGTKGDVLIPSARFRQMDNIKQPDVINPDNPRKKKAPKQPHPGWRNQDKKYQSGSPLLAGQKPQRPNERPARLTGRYFLMSDLTALRSNDFDNSFFRTGGNLNFENPFGRGGALRLDGEIDHLVEQNDNINAEENVTDLFIRRLSYASGGNRFNPDRWEAGRFLHTDMPEFGIIDGAQWSRRRKSGSRYGFSLGFLPELDDDLESFEDFAFSGYYLWSPREDDRLQYGFGYQKSLNNGNDDRDLVITKLHWYSTESWDFHATVWIDLYDGVSNFKPFASVTRAVVNTSRRWEGGDTMNISYIRQTYPEINRKDVFPAVQAPQIANDHYDVLRINNWFGMSKETRMHTHLAAWNDENHVGGSAELGFQVQNQFFDGTTTDWSGYINNGRFTLIWGGRVLFGIEAGDGGRWDLLYELANHRFDSFPADRDDVIQHRARFSRTYYSASGWDFTGYGEFGLWDEDTTWTLGFFLQRTF